MKEKELVLEKPENGVKPEGEKVELVLTDKQKAMLGEIIKEKNELQRVANEISRREIMISTLITDFHNIDDEQIESVQLNEEQTILTIIKK